MVAVRRLPPGDDLLKLVEAGVTRKEIAQKYGVTPEAVRQALDKAGAPRPETTRLSHAHYMPWRIRADHTHSILAKRLRLLSRHRQGVGLSANEQRQLDEWVAFMEGGNKWGVPLSVHYDFRDQDGFWLEPRRPGDRDFISPPK